MELTYSLRRARRVQANSTAPPSPMSPTPIISYAQSPSGSPSEPDNSSKSSHSDYCTSRECKLIVVDDDDSGHQLRPLKLPPRLSPCSTPLRPQSRGGGRSTAPSWSGLLGIGNSKNKDFDPFAAAVERIRMEGRDHDQRTDESSSLDSPSPSRFLSAGQNKRDKAGFLAFVGSSSRRKVFDGADESNAVGWVQNGDFSSSSSTMAIVKAKGSKAPSSAVYKERVLACFWVKK